METTGDVGGDNNACIGEESRGSCEVWVWKFASEVAQEGIQIGDVGFGIVTVSSLFRDP